MNYLHPFVHRLTPGTVLFLSLIALVPQVGWGVAKTGTISANETWSGAIEVTGNVTIPEGVSITVSAGAIVKFNPAVRLIIDGTFSAIGTSGSPITFTSIKDDSIGGDTNGDGATTTPAAGDWRSLENTSGNTANTTLQHVKIRYAGSSGAPALGVYSGALSVNTVSIEDCASTGVQLQWGRSYTFNNLTLNRIGTTTSHHGVHVANNGVSLTTTNLHSNDVFGRHVFLDYGPQTMSSTGSVFTGTGVKAIVMDGATLSSDYTWQDSAPYLLNGEVILDANASLTIAPGTKIYGDFNGKISNKGGKFEAIGTAENPIIFTSIKDDSIFGDVNGDADATSPAVNDWVGFATAVASAETRFNHCQISYVGRSQNAAIYANGGLVFLENSSISFSDTRGLYVTFGDVVLRNNTISDATYTGLWLRNYNGYAIMQDNHFENCATGVYGFEPGVQLEASGTTATNCGTTNAIKVTGNNTTIQDNQVWQEELLYDITIDLTLSAGVSWTLAPGTRIKVEPGKQITINGELSAIGTADAPIQFTSFLDDSIVGDTNEDLDATAAAPGDWKGMLVQGLANLDFDFVEMYYAGVGTTGTSAALRFGNGNTTFEISNSTFAYSQWQGVNFSGSPLGTFSGNTIRDVAGYGIYANVSQGSRKVNITNNLFENTGRNGLYYSIDDPVVVLGNTFIGGGEAQAIRFKGGLIPAGSTVTLEKNQTYVFLEETNARPYLEIALGATLIVEEGAVLKFGKFGGIRQDGHMELRGTEENPVILTSYLDDSVGGDSNGDGNATTPLPGDWFDIWIRDTWFSFPGLATGVYENVELRYAGLEYTSGGGTAGPAILLFGGNIEMNNILITDSLDAGFESRYKVGTATIDGMTIIDAQGEAIKLVDGTVSLNNINVENLAGPVLDLRLGNLDFTLENLIVGENVPNNTTLVRGNTLHHTILGHTPLVIVEDRIGVDRGPDNTPSSITILPGTTVKNRPNQLYSPLEWHDSDRGYFIFNGEPGNPIVFTSLLDDSVFGDSNGDGNASTPAPGDWSGISLVNQNSQINNVEVRYAGASFGVAVNFGYSLWGDFTFSASGLHIHDAAGDGLMMQNPLGADLSNCLIYDFENRGIVFQGSNNSSARLRNSTVHGGKVSMEISYGEFTAYNSVFSEASDAAVYAYGNDDTLTFVSENNIFYSPNASKSLFIRYNFIEEPWDYTSGVNDLQVDPMFAGANSRDFNPDTGSPLVDAANGSFVDGLDLRGFPRFDDPAQTDTGTGNPSYADIGAFEQLGSSDPTLNPDLQVVDGSITILANGAKYFDLEKLITSAAYMPGQAIEIEYMVKNNGASAALGNWEDALYFSTDRKWDIKDTLAGSSMRPSTLAPGEMYTHSISTSIPHVVDSSYHMVIKTDYKAKQLENKDYNNSGASQETFDVSVAVKAAVDSFPTTFAPGTISSHLCKIDASGEIGNDLNGPKLRAV
jgi:hypothetical protein